MAGMARGEAGRRGGEVEKDRADARCAVTGLYLRFAPTEPLRVSAASP